jgi:hypothetical protein
MGSLARLRALAAMGCKLPHGKEFAQAPDEMDDHGSGKMKQQPEEISKHDGRYTRAQADAKCSSEKTRFQSRLENVM